MELKYRDIIYAAYHSNHAGRGNDVKQLVESQAAFFKKEFSTYLPESKGAQILDIGAGNGSFILACKELGYTQLLGIDLSKEQISVGHSLNIKELIYADANVWLNEKAQSYDFISAIDLVEHLTKDELLNLLINIFTALKPGGTLLIRTPNLDCPLSNVYARGDFSHEVFLNKSSCNQVLLSTGFKHISIFPGLIENPKPTGEILRSMLFSFQKFMWRLRCFAFGFSAKELIFEPNLVAIAKK